jgi:hypothetical protein
MNERKGEMEAIYKKVGDLGAGAYLLMHGYRVVGRQGRAIVFEVEKTGEREFDSRTMEYLSSEFHRFDSCLMSLKKIGEYMPDAE